MSKVRILVVEDENIIALDLQMRLNSLGYEALAFATSGQEAMEKLDQLHPDLVLMDIRLRGKICGIEATRIIRTFSDVPIIFLTALVDEDTMRRAGEAGAQGLIRKPFQDEELHTVIKAVLCQP